METEITDIGKVAITPQKDYKSGQTYEWLDVVTYDGASYMCIHEDGCTGVVPTNTEYWQLLADKGHFTEEDKEEFKKAVVEESKTEINKHTDNKKTELNNYTTELEKSLENELNTYKIEKEVQLDLYKATLETEMANKKDSLIEEIETAQDGFDANVEEKTNTFNSNVETKTTEFNNNSNTKTEEFNNNSTEKINTFNSNAEEKIAEYDAHAETLTNRIADLEEENSELAQQMPWNTTEIQESIHVEDSAKYSKNKLSLFGNMAQETGDVTDEEGNTVGTMPSFEYPSLPVVATGVQKIRKCGKNFLPTKNITTTKNGLTFTVNEDGTITVNGTATAQTLFPINTISSGTQRTEKILKNTYTLSAGTDCSSETYFVQGNYSENNTIIYPATTSNNSKTFILSQDSYFGAGIIVRNEITCNNVIFKPQLEIADTATDYEPYNGKDIALDLGTTELCKITDSDGHVVAQDRAVYREVDGILKWQWEKNVLKAVMTATDTFTINTNSDNERRIQFVSTVFQNIPSNLSEKETEIKTRYNYIKPYSTTSTSKFRFFINYDDIGLETFISNTDAKNRLINLIQEKGDAVIYYVVTEPLYEDCTAEQSVTLDKLYKLQLEKGTNNIFVESENGVTCEMQLEYMQDNNLIQKEEHKALEDRITAIEALLSTTQTSALLLDNMQTDLEKEVE